MKYAIIAAGEGSRLAAEGINAPKPMVKVHGEHLIDRLIRVFMQNGAEEIVAICNDRNPVVRQHLLDLQSQGLQGQPVPLQFKVRNTPSSMHSFYELRELLGDAPFVLTTVDTIFRENEFQEYVKAFEDVLKHDGDGLMGVTSYIDDEKPLYIGTDDDMTVTGFYDSNDMNCSFISGGIYGLAPSALQTLENCMKRGESRMRNFQRGLIRDGRKLKAYAFSKVLDIDHASDIKKAEDFLSENA